MNTNNSLPATPERQFRSISPKEIARSKYQRKNSTNREGFQSPPPLVSPRRTPEASVSEWIKMVPLHITDFKLPSSAKSELESKSVE